MKIHRLLLTAALPTVILCGAVCLPAAAETGASTEPALSADAGSYGAYRTAHAEAATPAGEVPVEMRPVAVDGRVDVLEGYESREGPVVRIAEDAAAEWRVDVEEAGLYALFFTYYPEAGSGGAIERRLLLNGSQPFTEAGALVFPRRWVDGELLTDSGGNELRRSQEEAPVWMEAGCRDSSGFYNGYLRFYFRQGENRIRLEAVREPIVLGGIALRNPGEPPAYAAVKAQYKAAGYRPGSGESTTQAEDMAWKSDQSLYAECDRDGVGMTPYACETIRLNKIGSKWQMPGQTIAWTVTVPESGLYNIVTRYRQGERDGAISSRRLLIDGEVFCREADGVRFAYADRWQCAAMQTPDGERLAVYLEAGDHTLEMQVSLGDMAGAVGRTQSLVYDLNAAYRQILMITGTEPDTYRDYNFPEQIPETLEQLKAGSAALKEIAAELEALMGKGSFTSTFGKLAFDIDTMTADPQKIAARLEDFKSDLGSLATWVSDAAKQPLELDWIALIGDGGEVPVVKEGFFAGIGHHIRLFLQSFREDYSSSPDRADGIRVWVSSALSGSSYYPQVVHSSGLDQIQILSRMTEQQFTPRTGITVHFELVAPGTLLPAVLAGTNPDAALQVPGIDPMNYALRDAVADLASMEGFGETAARFYPESLVPYRYGERVFALPETFTYPMLFCRDDILAEQGLEPPDTWDDVYGVLSKLGTVNLQFGLPQGVGTYISLLYQNGAAPYTADGARSRLVEKTALQLFDQWTQLYTSYRSPVQYDFVNRFRTGEMPMAIVDVTLYNQLRLYAPEINGMWSLYPVPGTRRDDGTIDRSVAATGVASVILSKSAKQDEAWEFLKWWTGAPAQAEYGKELESVLGVTSRYLTANREATPLIAWSNRERAALTAQGDWARGIPEFPGSYITPRYVDFAFKAVVNEGSDPAQELLYYGKKVDEELARKREELGIS